MKPDLSTESEGSTLNVKQEQQQRPQQLVQNNRKMAGIDSSLIHNIGTQSNKKQAWFHQPNHHTSPDSPGNEAFIEAQVLRLTDECRLFQGVNKGDNHNNNENEDEDETTDITKTKNSSSNSNSLALFHRHEIQTSWNLLGNGAFSEVYTIQKFHILDEGFVDVEQKEAREKLQNTTPAGLAILQGQQCLQLGSTLTRNDQQQQCQQYVLKHIRRDLLTDRKKFIHAAGDLVMEAMYLSKLNHPNIIKLRGCAVGGSSAYGDGKHDGFFLILDRLHSTLSQKIQEWKQSGHQQKIMYSNLLIDFQTKLDIAYQIASALKYLHGRDIVYRDLKPDNIGLVNKEGGKFTVQLFDFGLCREIPEANPSEDKVFHMSGVGTRRYMSPEVYLGQYYNVKADVYSWSVVLHSMITLQRPFEMYDSKLHKLLVCQQGIRPTIYKEWPQPIQQLLRQGWASKSNDRPSMNAICSIIESLFEDIGYQYHNNITTPATSRVISNISSSVDEETRDLPLSSKKSKEESFSTRDSVEKSISDFVQSWTQDLCSGINTSKGNNKRSSKKSLLRTLEAHLMADTAGGQLFMIKDHKHPYYRDKLSGATDYKHVQHLRSSFL